MAELDLLIVDAAEVVTAAASPGGGPRRGAAMAAAGVIEGGYVAVGADGRLSGVGPMAELPAAARAAARRVIDARGRAVLPGFVDPHTHIVYGGDRIGEFKLRVAGADYTEIARAGGGIIATMTATRRATRAELAAATRQRLDRMLLMGTTTVEIKSGYGLTLADELKQLGAAADLAATHPVEVVPTFMGAHAVPPEYRDDPEAYVRLVSEQMLPAVARSGLARFNDVFCEAGVFDPDQARRILAAGKALGLAPKIHADEFAPGFGGAEAGAAAGAVSADHLLQVSDQGIAALAAAGTMAVLLPGTAFCLMLPEYAPARRLLEQGLAVALATDCNPGSCPIESQAVIIGLACLQMRLSPAEAVVGATLNAAHAIGQGARVGSIEVGKQADLILLSEPSHAAIPYRFGTNLVETVIKGGRIVVHEGRRVE